LFPLILSSTNQNEVPVGSIVDLSDLPDAMIKDLLKLRYIETAEGEPINVPGAPPTGQKKRR
jgi:hypothetical protein